MRTSLELTLEHAVERLKQELKSDNNASAQPASGSRSSSKGMLTRLLSDRKRTSSFEVPVWVEKCDQLCEQIKNSNEEPTDKFVAVMALKTLVLDQRTNKSSAIADESINKLLEKIDKLTSDVINLAAIDTPVAGEVFQEESPTVKKPLPPLPKKSTNPEAEAALPKPDQGVVRRSRADAVAPPRASQPAAPPKSNPVVVKRTRGGLPPSPSSSPTGSPEHKVVRRETAGKKVELSDLADKLDEVAKGPSHFPHSGRSSMARILRMGADVTDYDVVLFVQLYQKEDKDSIRSMVKNSFPSEMSAFFDKKPGDLNRLDKESFKTAVESSPQHSPKPGAK